MSLYRRLFAVLPLTLVVLDQITKAWVRDRLPTDGRGPDARIDVIDGFFRLVHRENPGAAFGIFRDFEHKAILFAVVILAMTVAVVWMARQLKPGQGVLAVALCCILAGGYGNFIDRVVFGTVTDFLEFRASGAFAQWTRQVVGTSVFPQFNVADICVNVGVALFVVHTLFFERRTGGDDVS